MDSVDRWLLLRAAGWLGIARIRLAATPFDRLVAQLSAKSDSAEGDSTGSAPATDIVKRIGFAVSAAANNVPWRSDCFPQTIAARMLLKRFGYASTIHFGVDRVGADELKGHAWLTCGETVVTGGTELDRYTEMYSTPL